MILTDMCVICNYNCLINIIYFRCGLTANPNTFGPLTNLPDYTFKDGRPTPLGVRQKARLDKQRDYAVCKINKNYYLL